MLLYTSTLLIYSPQGTNTFDQNQSTIVRSWMSSQKTTCTLRASGLSTRCVTAQGYLAVRMKFTSFSRLKLRRCDGIPQCWMIFQPYARLVPAMGTGLLIPSVGKDLG